MGRQFEYASNELGRAFIEAGEGAYRSVIESRLGSGYDVMRPQRVDRVMERLGFRRRRDGVYEMADPYSPIRVVLQWPEADPFGMGEEFGELHVRLESSSCSSSDARKALEWEAELHSRLVNSLSSGLNGENDDAFWLEMDVVTALPDGEYALAELE